MFKTGNPALVRVLYPILCNKSLSINKLINFHFSLFPTAPALVEDPLGKLILQPTMFDKSFSFNFTVSGTNLGPFIIKNGSKTMTNETFTQELSLTTGNFHYGQTTATLVSWRWDVTRSDLMKCENVTHYNGNYKFVASDQNPVGSSVDSTDFIIESFCKYQDRY